MLKSSLSKVLVSRELRKMTSSNALVFLAHLMSSSNKVPLSLESVAPGERLSNVVASLRLLRG